jgi:hypothetical protein
MPKKNSSVTIPVSVPVPEVDSQRQSEIGLKDG